MSFTPKIKNAIKKNAPQTPFAFLAKKQSIFGILNSF
jgi:hypothetical protein